MFYSNEEYWEAMPPWMREGYHKNTLVFQVVQSAMASNLPPSELVSKCGEVLLKKYTELQQEAIDRAMTEPKPFLISASNRSKIEQQLMNQTL